MSLRFMALSTIGIGMANRRFEGFGERRANAANRPSDVLDCALPVGTFDVYETCVDMRVAVGKAFSGPRGRSQPGG